MRPKGPANDDKVSRTRASTRVAPRAHVRFALSLLFSTASKVHLQRCFKCSDIFYEICSTNFSPLYNTIHTHYRHSSTFSFFFFFFIFRRTLPSQKDLRYRQDREFVSTANMILKSERHLKEKEAQPLRRKKLGGIPGPQIAGCTLLICSVGLFTTVSSFCFIMCFLSLL